MARPEEEVLFAVEGHVATITLNRPESRNALSIAVGERLAALWDEIDRRPEIRAVILTSADCGTFCAGMDLKEAAQVKQEQGVDILSRLKDPFHQRMRRVKAPIIAAITGHFAAGGMLLALNSDLRVALKGIRGGITEVRVGRGSPWAPPLLFMLPQPFVMEMVLTGDLFPVERFHHYGFITALEDTPEAVRARARQLAETIAANAPLSVKAGKATLLAAMTAVADAGIEMGTRLHQDAYLSEDAQEGPRAFAEKRPPRWQGR